MEKQNVFRVLSLDGGGMRGLYSATLLTELTKLFDGSKKDFDLGKKFNLICGTSTGSILASGLAAGVPINELKNIYIKDGKKIFPKPMPEPKRLGFYLWVLKHSFVNSGCRKQLERSLYNIFKDSTLNDIYEKRKVALCITAVDALNFKPKIFRTPHAFNDSERYDYKIVDAVLSSSSAPVLFPVNKIKGNGSTLKDEYYIDGGLWINNPVLLAILESLIILKNSNTPLEIISVSTCNHLKENEKYFDSPAWGLLKWTSGMRLMEQLLSAQGFGHNFMAELFSKFLNESGKNIKVIRLAETLKLPEEYLKIHADRPGKTAVKTMTQLAERDADYIFNNSSNDDKVILKDIFT